MNENENINNFRSGYSVMWVGSRQQLNSSSFALSPSHTESFFVRKKNLHKNAKFSFYCGKKVFPPSLLRTADFTERIKFCDEFC